jgi:hypothetical protein
MCASCGQGVAASIAGALTGRGYFICGMEDGGTATDAAGATARAGVCDGQPRTSWSTVPGPRWCWPVRTSTMIPATARSTSWRHCASAATCSMMVPSIGAGAGETRTTDAPSVTCFTVHIPCWEPNGSHPPHSACSIAAQRSRLGFGDEGLDRSCRHVRRKTGRPLLLCWVFAHISGAIEPARPLPAKVCTLGGSFFALLSRMGATPFHKTRDDDRAATPTSPGRRHGDPRHGAGGALVTPC